MLPRQPDAPTVISTFAGGGGSSLGYSMAGFRELLAVEWDANAVETLRLNFPGMPIYHGDIAKLSVDRCLEMAGILPDELDILDGSPPCQGFSTAGKRVLDDPRNGLFREYARLLRGIKPKVFVMENVSGMVKGKMKLVFAEILREFKSSGYKVKARLLNAMYYGVPQSRQRMIFIGVRDDLGIEPSHPKPGTLPITIERAIVSCPVTQPRKISNRAASIWDRLQPGQNGTYISGPNKDFSIIRLTSNMVCPTIRKGQTSGNGLMHWSERRYLSTSELSRIGSFPDYFRFTGTETDAVERIGNSVPPFLARAIARHVRSEILDRISTNLAAERA